ncbi:hypothetical protein GCM10022239_11590 [Leifsonia bigeumensis]|uniref:Tight adherence protein B n=1 Tax=Leifsonella bigeumensis TaxID=433643 RepID=A0ABP7FED3_9MICO
MAETASLDPVASVVQRLGVLLAAGVTPASAWGYLAESFDDRPSGGRTSGHATQDIVATVAARVGTEPVAGAILAALPAESAPRRGEAWAASGAAWRGLAAAWFVASDAGAPLAPSLRDLAGSLRDLAETQRDVDVALAGPAATAKFVTVLPVVGILFGLGLGFDTLGVLFGTVSGALCLAGGAALMLVARAWNRRLLRAATPKDVTPGLSLELLSIAVSGGASLDRARRAVASALERCELDGRDAELDEVLELSRRAGVPAGALLRSEAEQSRRIARSAARQKAAALSVTLMLPLGLCVLPAFLLLGVAPLMIAVISSTAGSF